MAEYIEREVALSYLGQGPYLFRADEEQAMWLVSAVPAADVVEVRHGAWDECECSVCGQPSPTLYMDDFELKYRIVKTQYCPNCGAKMDGKGEEE